jgi:sulfatase maturation enzyme AslB (radical SAM superfamily)
LIEYRKVFIGSVCNNNCLYCPYPQKESRDFSDVKTDLEKRGDCDSVEIFGGEPTLRSDLIEIIKFAKEVGYKRIKLRTNGRILSNWNALRMLISEGCYLFEIKVWGFNPQLFDSLTRAQGSFYETFQGIQNLISLTSSGVTGVSPFVSVLVPLVKENYFYAESIARSLFSFRIDRLTFSLWDFSLPLKEALYYVQNAIEACIFSKVWSLTEGIPPCFMEGFEHHVSEFLKNTFEGYVKAKKCKKCVYDDVCPGVKEGYYKSLGEKGIKPVEESSYLEDLRALKNE